MKIKRVLTLLIVAFMSSIFGVSHVHANSDKEVSVKAILPENQHNKKVTYYDLRMKPGQMQELELELRNPFPKDEKFLFELNDGTTNDKGVLDYSKRDSDYERDNTLKLALTEIANIPEGVIVKANSTKIIKIKLNMPREEFDGEIIGAIRISKLGDTGKKDSSVEGVQIKNKISYTVGIVLTENDKEVTTELTLLKVFASQTGGRNVVKANIQNGYARLLENVSYNGYVTIKGKTSVEHASRADHYRFAPNSNFNFDISWENQHFKAGDYTLFLKAESKDTEQEWTWVKDFKITSLEARRLNKNMINENEKNEIMPIIILITGIFIFVLIFILFMKLQNKPHVKVIGQKSIEEKDCKCKKLV